MHCRKSSRGVSSRKPHQRPINNANVLFIAPADPAPRPRARQRARAAHLRGRRMVPLQLRPRGRARGVRPGHRAPHLRRRGVRNSLPGHPLDPCPARGARGDLRRRHRRHGQRGAGPGLSRGILRRFGQRLLHPHRQPLALDGHPIPGPNAHRLHPRLRLRRLLRPLPRRAQELAHGDLLRGGRRPGQKHAAFGVGTHRPGGGRRHRRALYPAGHGPGRRHRMHRQGKHSRARVRRLFAPAQGRPPSGRALRPGHRPASRLGRTGRHPCRYGLVDWK